MSPSSASYPEGVCVCAVGLFTFQLSDTSDRLNLLERNGGNDRPSLLKNVLGTVGEREAQ